MFYEEEVIFGSIGPFALAPRRMEGWPAWHKFPKAQLTSEQGAESSKTSSI